MPGQIYGNHKPNNTNFIQFFTKTQDGITTSYAICNVHKIFFDSVTCGDNIKSHLIVDHGYTDAD